jgi:hypothetical protein
VVTAVDWRPSYRIIDSRYPFVGLFDRIADPADLEAAVAFESLTNERVLDELGDIHLVRAEDRVSGAGTTPIMAAFTHTRPSRFSDGSFGLYYAAMTRATAIAEVRHHKTTLLRATSEESIDLDMRVLAADIRATCDDLRTVDAADPRYGDAPYEAARSYARALRDGGQADGIVYRSLRDPSGTGECVAIFRPRCISNCVTSAYLGFRWDGTRIAEVYVRDEIMRFER